LENNVVWLFESDISAWFTYRPNMLYPKPASYPNCKPQSSIDLTVTRVWWSAKRLDSVFLRFLEMIVFVYFFNNPTVVKLRPVTRSERLNMK